MPVNGVSVFVNLFLSGRLLPSSRVAPQDFVLSRHCFGTGFLFSGGDRYTRKVYYMHEEFLMGNEAIALGALAAGVNLVAGYPGTPSTEVLETVAKRRCEGVYVEWSANEKAALEVAAGAAYSGARTMVTMKQVGLNVASDPLMSLAYIGVKGGMVIMVADDPGPISSQTEQDTRSFAAFSKLPCFDPDGVADAYSLIGEAFEYSERYGTPVIFRPTTRVCHAYASISVKDESEWKRNNPEGFVRDTSRWVIFPRLSYINHGKIEERNARLSKVFSDSRLNTLHKPEGSRLGIAAGGISYAQVRETLTAISDVNPALLRVATPFPFPEEKALELLRGLDEVLCVEELDPVIERGLTYVCGKYNLKTRIRGKLTGDIPPAGENSRAVVDAAVMNFLGIERNSKTPEVTDSPPPLPARPPVLCAGCPHRASFYAVKTAMRGRKSVFCGDIGCYTLGNAKPLDMVDTCLCMGAGVNIAQGIWRVEPDTICFAFVGDSTFFASALTGVVNAVYNRADMILVVLDNSTTAMTGHQPHPGTGVRMTPAAGGEHGGKISIEGVLSGTGVNAVETVDPLDQTEAVDCVKRMADMKGVRAIVFRSPCIVLFKPASAAVINSEACINCKACIKTIGCPAIVLSDGKVKVDGAQCTGCGLCAKVCPKKAISIVSR